MVKTRKALWQRMWRRQPPGMYLLGLAAAVALVMLIPLGYVVLRSLQADGTRWLKLWNSRIILLLWNTISLTVVVTVIGIILGVTLAWLVVRTDLTGKKYWQWLLGLPMLIPPYVGAMSYIMVFGPRGWARDWLGAAPFNIYGFWSVAAIMAMFTYPYVFLIVSSSLKRWNRNYEEVGLSVGMSNIQIFCRIILPLLRPAVGAGGILIALYVMSDFGGISMLRYTTFTSAIYFQIGSFNRETASILSTMLILLTLGLLFLEAKTREKRVYYQTGGSYGGRPRIVPLKQWKIPALVYVWGIFTIGVATPVSVLLYWSSIGIGKGALNAKFFGFAWNSLMTSVWAALLCMVLSLPVIYLKSRYPSVISTVIEKISYAGYALPGVIVALGMIFVFNQFLPFFYNTVGVVVLAYIIRFLPKSMQAQDSAFKQISPNLDDAARSLGCSPASVMRKITLPLILPGSLTGGALVFVSCMKELPTTLLLRAPGMDTLAVRVWIEAGEYLYDSAAPAALLILLVSVIPLKWMLSKY